MNVLLLGGGGREHALALRLARSAALGKLLIMPGNAGTQALGRNVPGDPSRPDAVLAVVRKEKIDLTIVGPEDPLAAGVVDALEAAGQRVFGPTRFAARLESDKVYAKQLMRQHAIPTAEARSFDDFALARQYIATRDDALVVKAAGLARGKGVVVCPDPPAALLAAERMLVARQFGDAGARIVVEEHLEGREVSLLAIVDGRTMYVLEPAQDYKRLGDGDSGPNTGGMGAYSPAATISEAMMGEIERQILVPILNALVTEEIRYRGVLYAGLMLTAGGPKVLEFNCRFGDPEAQVLMMRLQSDLLGLFDATVRGQLEQVELRWDPRPAVCVVMASQGYPEAVQTGVPVHGLERVDESEALAVLHAGTRVEGGRIVTAGGRVLGVTALGDTLEAARNHAYAAVEKIHFDGAVFRRDIAADALAPAQRVANP